LVLLTTACFLPGANAPVLLKVGLVAPFSGEDYGQGYAALYAVKAALADWNASPRAGRYRALLVANDTTGVPEGAAAATRKLVLDPDVLGAVALASDPTLAALADAAGAAELPLVTFGSAAPATPRPAVFRLDAGPTQVAERLLVLARASGGAVDLAWAPEDPYPALAADLQVRASGAGVHIAATVELPEHTLDFRAAAGNLDAPTLVYLGDAERGGQLLATLAAGGFAGTFLAAPGAAMPNLVKIAGPAAARARLLSLAPDLADAAQRERFRASYREQIDADPAPVSALAYDAASALMDALGRAPAAGGGPPARAAVAHALVDTDLAGTTGRVIFDAAHQRREAPLYLYQAQPLRFPGERIK
jgi:ABC-type branched-subunit amino acid transport system substrate-binding protein